MSFPCYSDRRTDDFLVLEDCPRHYMVRIRRNATALAAEPEKLSSVLWEEHSERWSR
jgi:hypothetical protein